MFLQDGLDLSTGLAQSCWAEFMGTYIPETTSKVRQALFVSATVSFTFGIQYEFGLASCGLADLYVDGKLVSLDFRILYDS